MTWLLLMWVNIMLLLKAAGDFQEIQQGLRKVSIPHIKKMSEKVQGHLPSINAIRESGSCCSCSVLWGKVEP